MLHISLLVCTTCTGHANTHALVEVPGRWASTFNFKQRACSHTSVIESTLINEEERALRSRAGVWNTTDRNREKCSQKKFSALKDLTSNFPTRPEDQPSPLSRSGESNAIIRNIYERLGKAKRKSSEEDESMLC